MSQTLSTFGLLNHFHTSQLPMHYFPFTKAVFQHQFGIRALNDTESIIEATDHYQDEVDLKRKLLCESRSDYFRGLPESAQAQKDAAELILATAPFIQECVNTKTGETIQDASHDPLFEIAKHVQEDLAIISGDAADGFRITAGAITFPSGWCIAEKIGLSMLDVHTPVPEYETVLHPPTEKLMERIVEGRPVCRTNWGVRPSSQLDQSPKHQQQLQAARAAINQENAGERCWFRVERQTLSRLSTSKDILFTIHTHQVAISTLSSKEREMLLGVLMTCPETTLAYKGILPIRSAVVNYLRANS